MFFENAINIKMFVFLVDFKINCCEIYIKNVLILEILYRNISQGKFLCNYFHSVVTSRVEVNSLINSKDVLETIVICLTAFIRSLF